MSKNSENISEALINHLSRPVFELPDERTKRQLDESCEINKQVEMARHLAI
jgi:hypothetical protein